MRGICKRHTQWHIAGIILLLFSACTEEIEFDLSEDSEPTLVVEGRITTETKAHEVRLSLSSNFYDEIGAPAATGAEVSIGDGIQLFELTEIEPGYYITDTGVSGEIGRTYNLLINYDGQSYEATATIDSVPPVDSLVVQKANISVGPVVDGNYGVFIYTKEKDGLGDYYMWHIYVNGENITDTLGQFNFQDDALFDGQEWEGVPIDLISVQPGDTVTLKQFTISREAFDLYYAAFFETNWDTGIFDTPSANVPSNISNGAYGLFDASDVSAKTVIVDY